MLDGWLETKELSPRGSYILAIENKTTGQFIGVTALVLGKAKRLSAEVWYNLHKDYWFKGYATEALNALLDLGFNTLKLHRIEAGCAVANIGSARVMEKVGMVKEGCKRKNLLLKDGWSDGYSYAILEEDFFRLS